MPSSRYVAIPGSERKPMHGATITGPCDPNEEIEVTVVLRHRPSSQEHASLAELVARGERITRDEFEARYGADPDEVQQVQAFAQAHGLKAGNVNLGARAMTLSGTVGAFSEAFQVKLDRYEHAGGSYRGRTGPIHVPEELKDAIRGVHGLDNRPQARTHHRLRPQVSPHAAAGPASYTAVQVAQLYAFPSGVNGQGQTIGIIELGGGYTQTDLDAYFSSVAITPSPSVSSVSVDGATNSPTGDPNSADTEVMLDIEVAGSAAPGANIVVYFAPNSDAGFLDAINQAVMDKTHKPSVLSISWGGPESSWTTQSLQSYNNALVAASAVGVTVCVAAGDDGSADGVTDGLAHVDFPASSPYALACGGTRLSSSGNSIASEVVWNDLPNNGATGGGVSANFAIPTWQAGAKVPPSVNPGNFQGRGVPDVSGDADPLSGYQVEVDGSSTVVGGTSAVAPLWAGLVALLNQSLTKPAGFLNPTLYQQVAGVAGTFRDITSGNNGSYQAGPGWDPCTGWGSPDGTAILNALSSPSAGSPAPAPTPDPTPTKKHHPKKPKKPPKRRK